MRCLFLLILGLVAACKPLAPPVVRAHVLNIDSLIDAQIKNTPVTTIEKTIHVNDSTFQSKANKVELKKELVAFQELNLVNRSIYRDSYQLTVESDKHSNLTVKSWIATKDAPVKSLKLFYLDKMDRLKRIEAELSTNDLYAQSSKKLSLDFSILGDTVRLETYSVSGTQQYFWSAPRYFSVDAVILR
jgi:hypothetical protein